MSKGHFGSVAGMPKVKAQYVFNCSAIFPKKATENTKANCAQK